MKSNIPRLALVAGGGLSGAVILKILAMGVRDPVGTSFDPRDGSNLAGDGLSGAIAWKIPPNPLWVRDQPRGGHSYPRFVIVQEKRISRAVPLHKDPDRGVECNRIRAGCIAKSVRCCGCIDVCTVVKSVYAIRNCSLFRGRKIVS